MKTWTAIKALESRTLKFRPTAFSFGPHARTVHDAGGKLIFAPFNRQKFNAELDRYAPGCGAPTRVEGTNGGTMPCGAKLGGKPYFCPACSPRAESRATAIVNKLLEADEEAFDAREYLLASTGRRIRISYVTITPESAEAGDVADRGWIDEEGEDMDPDKFDIEDGVSAAQKAAKFLNDKGAYHPSSSPFHTGVWYSDSPEVIDYATGEEEERSYHLSGFTPEEEQKIFNEVALKI